MQEFRTALEVKPLSNYRLWLRFDNGEEGSIDLSHMIKKGVFKAWQDPEKFKRLEITDNNSVISWENDIDMSVDCLYECINKKS